MSKENALQVKILIEVSFIVILFLGVKTMAHCNTNGIRCLNNKNYELCNRPGLMKRCPFDTQCHDNAIPYCITIKFHQTTTTITPEPPEFVRPCRKRQHLCGKILPAYPPSYPPLELDENFTASPVMDSSNWSFSCTSAGNFPDPIDCTAYWQCDISSDGEGFKSMHKRCPVGKFFDCSLRECVLIRCQRCGSEVHTETTTIPPCESKTYPSTIKVVTVVVNSQQNEDEPLYDQVFGTTPTTTTLSSSYFTCDINTAYPDTKNCSMYYKCHPNSKPPSQNSLMHYICAPGTAFDPNLGDCTVQAKAYCNNDPNSIQYLSRQLRQVRNLFPSYRLRKKRYFESKDPIQRKIRESFHCTGPGRFVNENDHKSYFLCYPQGHGFAYLQMSCPVETVFNAGREQCVSECRSC